MNALDDLRRTLDDHATGLVDHDLASRSSSVHRRVAVVRRRRRAAAAGGVAAVLAVAAGVALVPRSGHQPAPATRVVGVEAPTELHSLGFTYQLTDSVDGHDGRAVLRLDASPEPRLVSWATSGGDDTVTVDAPTTDGPITFTDRDFGNWVTIPAGDPYTVKATAVQGQPGLAVYTLAGDRPAGLTQDGVTFRQTIAGGRLLGAVVGSAGQADVTAPATATGPGVAIKYYCSGGPADAYLHIDYTGEQGGFIEGSGCNDQLPVDPASLGGSGAPSKAGEDVGLHYYVTQGRRGPRVEDAGLHLGIGVYALDTDPVGPQGFTPPSYEEDGHAWTRVDRQRSASGVRRLVARAPVGRGSVLVIVYGNLHDAALTVDFDGRDAGVRITGGGANQALIADGGTVTVTARGDRLRAGDDFGVAFYVRSD